MARKKAPSGIAIILNQLQTWASRHQVSEDPYVGGLLNAISKKKNLPMWATLDPVELLPFPESKAGGKRLRLARQISIIRNTLVFAPVALTWEAVAKATTAFAKFVQLNSAATVNFLEFWQDGYEVLGKFWTVSNIAQIDFLIVFVIIILSVIVSIFNEQGRNVRIQDRTRLDLERMSLAISIKLFLYSKREVSNVTLNNDLATAIQDLSNATSAISKVSSQLENSIQKFPKDSESRKEFHEFFKRLNSVLINRNN